MFPTWLEIDNISQSTKLWDEFHRLFENFMVVGLKSHVKERLVRFVFKTLPMPISLHGLFISTFSEISVHCKMCRELQQFPCTTRRHEIGIVKDKKSLVANQSINLASQQSVIFNIRFIVRGPNKQIDCMSTVPVSCIWVGHGKQ